MSTGDRFTDKQRAFIDAYFACGFNATEAAKRAGYSKHTARFIATENLSKPNIRAEIDRRMDKVAMPANEVLARIADIARSTMDDFLNETGDISIDRGRDRGVLHLIKSRSVTDKGERIELYSKFEALALLAKHHGLLVDRTELSGLNGAPLMPPIREVVIERNDKPLEA